MAHQKLVCVCTGDRSERGLLEPIIKRLRNHKTLTVTVFEIDAKASLSTITKQAEDYFSRVKPDIVLTCCDRREMVPVAMVSFFMQIPTVNFLGGTYSFSGTPDDVSRHILTTFAHVMCVEDKYARELLRRGGEDLSRIHVTGTTHFDDLEVDASLCPEKPYNLFLMNPVPLYPDRVGVEMISALTACDGKRTVFIGPNSDEGSDIIRKDITEYCWDNSSSTTLYENGVPRPKFLGLLKNCHLFVSNSSATIYEAPEFGVRVYNPSIRNNCRTRTGYMLKGGADNVVKVLENLDLNDKFLLAKQVRKYSFDLSNR